jgi:hypothetical protein
MNYTIVRIDLDAQIEYGYQLMQNCGYNLGYDSALQTQLMCKKILANKLSEQK